MNSPWPSDQKDLGVIEFAVIQLHHLSYLLRQSNVFEVKYCLVVKDTTYC